MSGKLPTEYNGLLRLLKEEQKHIQRLQEQIKKSKDETNTARTLLSEKEKKSEADAAVVRNISTEMAGVKSSYSSLELKMEQMTKKWIQNTRLLNQYRYATTPLLLAPLTMLQCKHRSSRHRTSNWGCNVVLYGRAGFNPFVGSEPPTYAKCS